jgi:hypothetical protein
MPSVWFAQPIELPSIPVREAGAILFFASFIGSLAYEKSSAVRLGRLQGHPIRKLV